MWICWTSNISIYESKAYINYYLPKKNNKNKNRTIMNPCTDMKPYASYDPTFGAATG